ncbi:Uncharacterized conserved protein YibQ, putative polysaccharide deacetylase 2 family [Cribrihabitans marinus]|uniref:Uncharacterized conserved protein YibQ, putative polysaccharide deacetylase 2 family n=1 Tax=Cribrihabitans marinus TaxID=1227549 RepID=A0A1H7DZF6_9RHOB|nr:divergent polysaccharide deacetylase family protein [Cribrihabitans marinus]GGH40387.1 hypothetical protein GCM10010973_36790 [Cribrihabitans marinus]SEK05062.1 Uncharacterized conserved protein YibQ, putative polysaccharide deacetylase 2 family [Cribrihabitans marinus]
MSGFFGGMVVGAVVVVGGAAFVSLSFPVARQPDVSDEAPANADPAPVSEAAGVDAPGRDADLVELAPRAPADPADGGGTVAADDEATAPAAKPEVTVDAATPSQPGESDPATLDVTGDVPPARTAPTVEAPKAPAAESGVVASTERPAQPRAPEAPDAAEAEDAPIVASEPDAPPAQEPEAAPEDPAAEDEGTEQAIALPQIGGDSPVVNRPTAGTPVIPLTERDEAEEPAADAGGKPPIKAHAVPFENPDAKPLLSIVLIDGPDALGAEALAEFPYPVTFALDPTDPEASEKMARHRAAGFEVVMLADLPPSATARDAEVSMEVWLSKVPESVAILEGTETGIQGNRELSDQVTDITQSTGRGLITQDKGLNTVQKLAARDGVPAAVVFRDFDGAGQSSDVIRRFLDQAAFRAGQEGAVIMLGRVRPDTISSLLLWGLQDRASRVALAPVSAVLTRQVPGQ